MEKTGHEICSALDIGLPEILRLTGEQKGDSPDVLSLEQERALAEDPNLFACFYLLVNGRSGRDVCCRMAEIDPDGRRRFAELAETELIGLHEGNFAPYRIRPSEFAAWRQVWEAK